MRANPEIRLFGTPEHCDDIKAEIPAANCVAVFHASAEIGAVAELPARTLPGVGVTAVKQAHSGSGGEDGPFTWQGECAQIVDYPVDPNEPMSWAGPTSGYVDYIKPIVFDPAAPEWRDCLEWPASQKEEGAGRSSKWR